MPQQWGSGYANKYGIQTERMFDVADVAFSAVSEEEKQKYAGKMLETGSYQGYKLRRYWVSSSPIKRI